MVLFLYGNACRFYSEHPVVDGEYLELGATVDLVGDFPVGFGKRKDVLFGQYVAFLELRVFAREFFCNCLWTRFPIALRLQPVGRYSNGYKIVDDRACAARR